MVEALGIWTHIAGQRLEAAPAPLAFVPAIVHSVGAYTVRGGIHRVPLALEAVAKRLGVTFRYRSKVERIVRRGRRVVGVIVDGQLIRADHVVSDAPGIGTCARLVDPPDPALNARLEALPLQSPGVAAYLTVERVAPGTPFLEFELPGGHELVRLRIAPGAVDPERAGQARFLSPVDHAWAERVGPEGQRRHLEALLAEPWWTEGLVRPEVVATRVPAEWGRRYHLYRDSMNPVMTAAFMRRGRMPHHGLLADDLTLVGSATHPGQWVSFCAISGVVAARGAR